LSTVTLAGTGRFLRPPNGTVAKLRAASHTNRDAARQLRRLTNDRREQTATAVTPSQAQPKPLQRRASESAVRQLQLLVRRRRLRHALFTLNTSLVSSREVRKFSTPNGIRARSMVMSHGEDACLPRTTCFAVISWSRIDARRLRSVAHA
jgi:hypothetical protein